MFKNIIFDWSGVIKDAAQHQFWVVNKIFERLGVKEITFQEMQDTWEQPYMKFYNQYLPELSLLDEQAIYREMIVRKDCPIAKEYLGASDLIKKLKESGKSLCVLSSDTENSIVADMKEYGLEHVFDEVYAHVYDKAEKIHELIEKNNFDPKKTVFIGDSNHEIEVGKLAGVKTIAVTWGFSSEKKLKSKHPDYIVNTIQKLEEVLLR